MANLFDKLNSSFVSDTQSSHLDTSSEVEQTTIDVDALTGFTIPRKKRKTDFSLEEVAQDSRSFKDIVSVVERSFKGKDKEIFTCSKCFLVHNADRLKAFLEKKTELKDGKDVHESYAFQMFSSDHDAKAVCKAGLRVGNTNMSFLGKADLGVYVCKHADMMTSKKLSRGFIGRMVVYKVLKGKVKFVTENWTGEALEPTPNFDCHVSKTSAATYESAQLYLYEYDEDFEIVEKPRQVLPYALVYFTLTKDQRQSTSAVLTAHRAGSFNLPLEKHPLFQRSNSTDLTGVVPSTEPVSQQVITDNPSNVTSIPAADRASNQQEVDDSSLNPQSTTGANVSPVKKTPDLPAKQRVGKPGADGKGVVVWTGNMISDGGLPLCEVDMISYASPITPGLLDNQLMISKTVSWSSLISLVFNNVVSLSRESETRVCEMYYSYFQINPTDGHQEMFKAFIAYLNKKQRGAYVILENSKAVLLPACLVTHNFKLTEPDEPSENLHCILISQQPRAIELKGRISSKDNGPKEQTKNGSQLGVLCYPEPDLLYEAGFLPSLPATCYIFLEALREDCIRQGEAQDKRNIEEARKERYKQSMSNRSLSTQSSDGGSCSQPPLCSDKMKALPFGLESLKRHPLFAVNPPVSDMNRDIKAYSDRITSSAGFSETSQTSSSGYSSLGPAVYKSPLLSETPAARTTLPPQGARSYQYSTSQRSFTDSTQSVLLRSPTGSNPQQCSATSVGAVDIVNIAGNPYANNPAFVNSNPAGNLCANDPAVGNSSQSRLHDNAPSMPYQSAIGSSSTCSEPLNNLSAITSDNHSVLGSKPSTTRRSLIMSLPLPPGEDLSNYKQLKTTSLSSKHKSRKIISSESEGSSSSSEESEEDALADDLVDGIIKMRPVKEVLSLSKHKKNSSGENEASPAKTATITAAVRPELGSFVITKTSKEKSESKEGKKKSKKRRRQKSDDKDRKRIYFNVNKPQQYKHVVRHCQIRLVRLTDSEIRSYKGDQRKKQTFVDMTQFLPNKPKITESNAFLNDLLENEQRAMEIRKQREKEEKMRKLARTLSRSLSHTSSKDDFGTSKSTPRKPSKRPSDTKQMECAKQPKLCTVKDVKKKEASAVNDKGSMSNITGSKTSVETNKENVVASDKNSCNTDNNIQEGQNVQCIGSISTTRSLESFPLSKVKDICKSIYKDYPQLMSVIKDKPVVNDILHDKPLSLTKTNAMTTEGEGESRLSKGTEKSLQVNDVIDSCVSTALHRKVAPKATAKSEEEQANWSQFWSVALHYLLPLKNILKQAAVLDSEKHSAVSSNKPVDKAISNVLNSLPDKCLNLGIGKESESNSPFQTDTVLPQTDRTVINASATDQNETKKQTNTLLSLNIPYGPDLASSENTLTVRKGLPEANTDFRVNLNKQVVIPPITDMSDVKKTDSASEQQKCHFKERASTEEWTETKTIKSFTSFLSECISQIRNSGYNAAPDEKDSPAPPQVEKGGMEIRNSNSQSSRESSVCTESVQKGDSVNVSASISNIPLPKDTLHDLPIQNDSVHDIPLPKDKTQEIPRPNATNLRTQSRPPSTQITNRCKSLDRAREKLGVIVNKATSITANKPSDRGDASQEAQRRVLCSVESPYRGDVRIVSNSCKTEGDLKIVVTSSPPRSISNPKDRGDNANTSVSLIDIPAPQTMSKTTLSSNINTYSPCKDVRIFLTSPNGQVCDTSDQVADSKATDSRGMRVTRSPPLGNRGPHISRSPSIENRSRHPTRSPSMDNKGRHVTRSPSVDNRGRHLTRSPSKDNRGRHATRSPSYSRSRHWTRSLSKDNRSCGIRSPSKYSRGRRVRSPSHDGRGRRVIRSPSIDSRGRRLTKSPSKGPGSGQTTKTPCKGSRGRQTTRTPSKGSRGGQAKLTPSNERIVTVTQPTNQLDMPSKKERKSRSATRKNSAKKTKEKRLSDPILEKRSSSNASSGHTSPPVTPCKDTEGKDAWRFGNKPQEPSKRVTPRKSDPYDLLTVRNILHEVGKTSPDEPTTRQHHRARSEPPKPRDTLFSPRTDYRQDSLSRQPFNFGRDMAILAKKSLREYYDLPALTHSQFSSRFQQFKTRAKQVISKSGRFVGLQFQRSTLQEVDEARKQGNKEEIEEYEFTEKDVKNFDELVTTSRSSPS